ncbi:DNA (cytosine-5-)-methyltransferase [Catenibacterium mitsuokai]|uniref:DNA (cytosine-5-)-methyltransferase n=1 Tax=Catenibacterium mitsuokai TaxID=100886 RepID=UPI003F8E312A
MFKVIETFSGIGSQAKALERIGSDFEIVHTAEWDIYSTLAYCLIHRGCIDVEKYANVSDEEIMKFLSNKTLSADGKSEMSKRYFDEITSKGKRLLYTAFKETRNLGSITDISWKDIPEDIDMLTYSFPCQDLSLCGFWHGNFSGIDRNSGNRSSLLWEIERILFEINNHKRRLPKFLVMENVKAILSSRHAKNFGEWKDELESLGYINHIYQLNASNFGIPQKRVRVYMISIFCGNDEALKENVRTYLKNHDLNDFDYYHHEKINLDTILKTDYSENIYFKEAVENIPNNTPSRREIYNTNTHLVVDGKTQNIDVNTLTTKQDRNPNSGVIDFPNDIDKKSNFRYLTPRECFLLMGFDESDFDKVVNNNFQLTNRKNNMAFKKERLHKMAGNSIVVTVLESIFRQLQEIDELYF